MKEAREKKDEGKQERGNHIHKQIHLGGSASLIES